MPPTRAIAEFISGADALPPWLMHETKRTLVNILAVSISAVEHRSSRRLIEWARAEEAAPRATVLGSGLRTSPATAALLNGFLAHLQDYDDTHFPTVLHPSAPVWPAVLASAEERGISGHEALVAFGLGAEVACRVAMSVHPWHYDRGWHITGTAGVFGAAAGTARVLGLPAEQTTYALGLAGTQAAGVREVFGSDGKPMHAGKAASNGLQAAAFAGAGLTAADDILDGRRGFWAVLSPDGHSEQALLGDLGTEWELRRNGLKPYANGVVSHPIQDAVIRLRNEHKLQAGDVERIEARVSPLVLELMNRAEPRRGLEGKFSFQHCAVAALVDGAGHDAQFTDEKVADPVIAALRARVVAQVEPAFPEEQAAVTIVLNDGRRVTTEVEHASGSPENPLSDETVEEKFRALVSPVLGERRSEELLAVAWGLDEAPDVRELMALASPGDTEGD
jgi:2-methylcitrate dehydratase PrpD